MAILNRFAFLLLLCVMVHAQILEVSSVTVKRGSADIFRVVLTPSAEKTIAALQWDVVYPDGLRIEPSGVVSGAVSEKAGKMVQCAPRPSEGANHRLTCILAGGVQALPAGVIVIVRFEAATDVPQSEMSVQLEKVVGVTPSLESVPMKNTRVPITIR